MTQGNGLTIEEETQLVELLNKLRWSADAKISQALFEAICRAFTTACVELVVARRRHNPHAGSAWEAALCTRPANDPFYALRTHSPGGCFYGHQDVEEVLRRIVERSVREPFESVCDGIHFVTGRLAKPARGQEVALIFVLHLPDDFAYNGDGAFYRFGEFPPSLLDHHRGILDDVGWWIDHGQGGKGSSSWRS